MNSEPYSSLLQPMVVSLNPMLGNPKSLDAREASQLWARAVVKGKMTIDHLRKEQEKLRTKKIIFSCLKCEKIFSTRHSLNYHINVIHLKTRQRYACTECDKTFPFRGSLKVHVDAVHLKLRPFSCEKLSLIHI